MSTATAASLAPRADFPLLAEYTYLNSASIGLESLPVQRAGEALQAQIAGRGTVGFDDEVEKQAYDVPRATCARLLGASEADVAITTNATEALGQIAWWLRPARGTNVVSLDVEFPSVTYPWLRVAQETGAEVRLGRVLDDPESLSIETVARLVDDDTAAICVSHVQYATGYRLDPVELVELAHAHGATLVLDASQSAGVVPIDVAALGVDVLVATAYKWICGAPGASICYMRPELRERFEPPFVGWRSTPDPPRFDATKITLASALRRMEFSTPPYAAGAALGAAVDYLLELGVERIYEHDLRLAVLLMDGLESLGGIVLTPRENERRAGIVIARFPGRSGEELASKLFDERVVVAPRLGSVRFASHMFNDESDVARALDVLDRILGTERSN